MSYRMYLFQVPVAPEVIVRPSLSGIEKPEAITSPQEKNQQQQQPHQAVWHSNGP